MLTIPH